MSFLIDYEAATALIDNAHVAAEASLATEKDAAFSESQGLRIATLGIALQNLDAAKSAMTASTCSG
jgi:hypothetical protein